MTEPDVARKRVETEQDHEELKERLEREHNELLQELRSLIPGAEVLFGFLLAISFTNQFDELTSGQRYVYYATLLSTATALVFFLAPAAHHRIRFRAGDKEYSLRKGNRETIAGTVAASIALTGVIYLVTAIVFGTTEAVVVAAVFFVFLAWRWWAYALWRDWQDRELDT
jgi:amino acid transporter